MSSTTDKLKGAANQVAGKVKQGVGEATDDPALKGEGRVQEAKGDLQKAVGKGKDAIKRRPISSFPATQERRGALPGAPLRQVPTPTPARLLAEFRQLVAEAETNSLLLSFQPRNLKLGASSAALKPPMSGLRRKGGPMLEHFGASSRSCGHRSGTR